MTTKRWVQKMCPNNRTRLLLPALLLAILLFLATGCGLRQSQTGSLSSRVVDADGNAVVNAEVFSIFAEREKVLTGLDGGFYLSELPAGLNNIVILHPDFVLEERQIEVKSGDATVVDFIRLDRSNAPNRISNVKVAQVASSTVLISWQTYRSVICSVEYGTSVFYGQNAREQRPAIEHSMTLTGLNPETLYHFRVFYVDDSGKNYFSYDYSFKTDVADRPAIPASLRLLPFESLGIVGMEWAPAVHGLPARGFNVYRQYKGTEWLKLNETPLDGKTLSYTDTTAASGRFCRYAVRAVDGFGAESEQVETELVFLPGVINEDTVLALTDSPVRLYSDIIVAAGATLVVEAGTEVQVSETDAFAAGENEDKIEVIIHGRLEIRGSSEQPVAFAPLNGSGRRDHWAGIKILSSQTGISDISFLHLFGCEDFALDVSALNVRINGLAVAYSRNGLRVTGVRDVLNIGACSFSEIAAIALEMNNCRRVTVEGCSFSDVHTGIVTMTESADDQTIIKNCDIYASETGISGVWGRNRIIGTLVVSRSGTGIVCQDVLHAFDNYIDHVTVDAARGIEIISGTVNVQNNIIVNRLQNGIVGIRNQTGQEPEYQFNDVYGFFTLYQGCSGTLGATAIDPKFVAGNPFDYRLMPDSTLKLQDIHGSELGRYGVSRL